jgi:GT2 family glycosyltransferase
VSAGLFAAPGERADVAVAVVTFNSADHVGDLLDSLRGEARTHRLRVIVADNGSTDATRRVVGQHADVVLVETGGNRGYATGINAALRHAGDAPAILVLNPDLVVEPGAVGAMLERLDRPGVGAVVPTIRDAEGAVYPSLRREPSVRRALGDALLGGKVSGRPHWSSETVDDPAAYRDAHPVDWATGAALLVRRDVADAVGPWDPRFFLYSEETDYLRRVRDLGHRVWFEPAAVVRHDQGGSGFSPRLATLMTVNRVRYVRKHHGAAYSVAFHCAVIAHEALRAYDADHRASLHTLLDPPSWRRLPRATRWPAAFARSPGGAIIIPAHNEAAVIGRTLEKLAPVAGQVEIIVVCNGCTDATASVARSFDGVRVIEIARPSKTAALNAGDDAAQAWPRLYLDADIEIHPGAVRAVFAELERGTVAARPAFVYDTAGASAPVRSYYRARERMPAISRSLWGAGAYALSAAGHERLGRFPDLLADDLYVDRLFAPAQKVIVATEPVRVRTPRTVSGLLAVLTRQSRGNTVVRQSTTFATVRALVGGIHGPLGLADAIVYAALTAVGRRRALTGGKAAWDRDDSSRVPPSSPATSTAAGEQPPPYRGYRAAQTRPARTRPIVLDDGK